MGANHSNSNSNPNLVIIDNHRMLNTYRHASTKMNRTNTFVDQSELTAVRQQFRQQHSTQVKPQRHSAYYFNTNAINSVQGDFDNSFSQEGEDEASENGHCNDDEDDENFSNEDGHSEDSVNQDTRYGFGQPHPFPHSHSHQSAQTNKVKTSKKFNKLFKFITNNQNNKSSQQKQNATSLGLTVKKRDAEKVKNRKKNNLFAKSLTIMSSAVSSSRSKLNVSAVAKSDKPSRSQPLPPSNLSTHHLDITVSSTNTKLKLPLKSTKSCSSSSGCSSAASSSNLSSRRHITSAAVFNSNANANDNNNKNNKLIGAPCLGTITNLSSSTSSVLSSSHHPNNLSSSLGATVIHVTAENKASTPLSILQQPYRNNSYLNGLNATGIDETITNSHSAASNTKYSAVMSMSTMTISPSALSLDKSNTTSLNSSELTSDVYRGNPIRAHNRKIDQFRLKSKSMYAENEFMDDDDDDDDDDVDDDEDDEKDQQTSNNNDNSNNISSKAVNKKKSMAYRVGSSFRIRLSLKHKSSSKQTKSTVTNSRASTATSTGRVSGLSRDSGIISDIFSHLGSMSNLKCKLHSAGDALRHSFSVFNIKAATSSQTTRTHKSLVECNENYFATGCEGQHIESNQQQQPPVMVPSESSRSSTAGTSFKSILKRGTSISSAASSHLSTSAKSASSSSSSSSSKSSFSSNYHAAMLKRTTTFHSTHQPITNQSSHANVGGGVGDGSVTNLNHSAIYQHRKSLDSTDATRASNRSIFQALNNIRPVDCMNNDNTNSSSTASSSHHLSKTKVNNYGSFNININTASSSSSTIAPNCFLRPQAPMKITQNSNSANNRLITPSSLALVPPSNVLTSKPGPIQTNSNNSATTHRHQKIVVQASTNDLLRCLITYLSKQFVHLIRLDIYDDESSNESCTAHSHFPKLVDYKFRVNAADIINWLRAPDRILLLQGWQDVAFMNPVNVVFVYMLVRDSLRPSELRCAFDLQCSLMSCLYLAFSYMGNEISYPLKPFLIEDDRDVFWQRQVNLMSELSHNMLRINQEPRFFTELFYELKSYSVAGDNSILLDNSALMLRSIQQQQISFHKSATVNVIAINQASAVKECCVVCMEQKFKTENGQQQQQKQQFLATFSSGGKFIANKPSTSFVTAPQQSYNCHYANNSSTAGKVTSECTQPVGYCI